MFSPISIASLAAGMAVVFGMAIADDSPAITAELDPWLDQVEIMRVTAEDLADQWQLAESAPTEATTEFEQNAHQFVTLTEETSSRIRALESGNDAACILHGIALDVGTRLEALGNAANGAARAEVLNGIDRLLFEGLLIFGRQQEAQNGPTSPYPGVIAATYVAKEGQANPHPFVETDCDGNPLPQK